MPWIDVKLYDHRVTEESVPKIIESLTTRARGVERRRAGAHPGRRAGHLAQALGPGWQAGRLTATPAS